MWSGLDKIKCVPEHIGQIMDDMTEVNDTAWIFVYLSNAC